MNFQLHVPAKTFILGEYLVLRGGPAILLTSDPSFRVHVSEEDNKNKSFVSGIHSESPAGKFINRHKSYFDKFNLEFIDPYKGIGGLGASSAQFALVYALKMGLKNFNSEDLPAILKTYSHCAWDGEGIAPSGADVLSQLQGGLCLFHPEKQSIEKLDWPFDFLDYCLIHTNNKIATHHHLKSLYDIHINDLDIHVDNAVDALARKDGKLFAESIKEFRKSLVKKQLVLHETEKIVNQIDAQQGVWAAKGCGALGADIIFVLLESKRSASFINWCAKNYLRVICSGQKLGEGLTLKSDFK